MTAPTTTSWAVPGARMVLPAGAPREVWLAERRKGIGGSDAPAVLGLSPYRSPYEVWAEKRGLLPEQAQTDAMAWGVRLEPLVADWFAETSGLRIRKAGLMRSRRWPFMQVTVDRLVEGDAILECKTLSWRMAHEWDDDDTPDAAAIQSHHALAVTGRSRAYVVGLVDGRQPKLRIIDRDERLVDDLTAIEADFWALVESGTEPPLDGSDSTTGTLRTLYPATVDGGAVDVPARTLARLLSAKHRADARLKKAEEAKARADNALRRRFGYAETLTVGGIPAATYKHSQPFNASLFKKTHPELAAKFSTTVEVVDVKRVETEAAKLYHRFRGRRLHIEKGF